MWCTTRLYTGSATVFALREIVVNDMVTVIDSTCELYLYADDSALAVSGKNVKEIEAALSKNMSRVSEWLSGNRLSLHLGKTECILFGSKKKLSKCNNLNIICNGVKLENKTCKFQTRNCKILKNISK